MNWHNGGVIEVFQKVLFYETAMKATFDVNVFFYIKFTKNCVILVA